MAGLGSMDSSVGLGVVHVSAGGGCSSAMQSHHQAAQEEEKGGDNAGGAMRAKMGGMVGH